MENKTIQQKSRDYAIRIINCYISTFNYQLPKEFLYEVGAVHLTE